MKKFYLFNFIVLCLALLSSSAFAAGYGSAGCGLGSILFGDNPNVMAQVSAQTTNGSTFNQSFGITSGTSNCDATGLVLAQKEQEIFAERNFDSIAKEMATGKGENLNVLAGLLGCTSEATSTFGAFTKENYNHIFEKNDVSSADMLNAVKDGISKDSVLSKTCNNVLI